MHKNPHPAHPGDRFLEQLHAFANQFRAEEGRARDVATRPGEVRHEPALDGISHGTEDNGDRQLLVWQFEPRAYFPQR